MQNFSLKPSQPASRPLVFLDIDDVLAVHRLYNTREALAALRGDDGVNADAIWRHIFHASARDNLRRLHDEFEPMYVISSSWTLHLNHGQFAEIFHHTGLEFVPSNFHEHWRTPREEGSYRLMEIDGWLDEHMLLTPVPYLIIDDVISGQSIPGSHLEPQSVLCDAWVGFTHPKLKTAQKILRSQLEGSSS